MRPGRQLAMPGCVRQPGGVGSILTATFEARWLIDRGLGCVDFRYWVQSMFKRKKLLLGLTEFSDGEVALSGHFAENLNAWAKADPKIRVMTDQEIANHIKTIVRTTIECLVMLSEIDPAKLDQAIIDCLNVLYEDQLET